MAELQVRVYDVSTNEEKEIHLGNLYFNVEDERADRILRNYEATLMGVIDPVCYDFLDEIQGAVDEKFKDYLEGNPCDFTVKIAKRI
jgi:hypothetical protein